MNTYAISLRLLQFSLFSLALFIPFSIAATNFAIGFAVLGWIAAAVAERRSTTHGEGAAPASPAVEGAAEPGRPLSALRDPILWAVALVALGALPSLFGSENISRAYKDWRSYWLVLFYLAVAANAINARMREPAFWTLFASTTLASLMAFVQWAGGSALLNIGAEHRVSGTLYIMTFAGILCQVIIVNVSVALRSRLGGWRFWVLSAGTLCQLTALMLTVTRGAWLALISGLVAVALLVRNRRVLVFGAVALAAIAVFSSLYSGDKIRTISISSILESGPDRNVRTRFVLWDIAWDLFERSPLTGVGMGDFTAEAEKLLADREVRTTADSHNVYLHVLATRGLVGFLPFVFFWIVLYRELFRLKNRLPRGSLDHAYVVGAIAVTVAVMVGALTENNVDDEEIFIAFMFILGLARAAQYRRRLD